MYNLSDNAMMIALEAHDGQKNKHTGEPYILHVARVALACKDRKLSPAHVAVAWLHDVVEDTEVTISDLMKSFPFDPEIVQAVDLLTKPADGSLTNEDYYRRIAANKLAAYVKVRDIHDNFNRNHLILDDVKRLRMAHKYSLGLDILRDFI
jgi:(p)ppGpp synthase/HD superfamily hydrolase